MRKVVLALFALAALLFPAASPYVAQLKAAAPTFVDFDDSPAGGGSSATSTTFNWNNIAGLANDDVAVVYIYRETTAAYTATPAASGWAQLANAPCDQGSGGFKFRADIWWKRRAGDTGTVTWSWSGAAWRFNMGAVYRGLITSETPIIGLSCDAEANQNDEPIHPGITIARTESAIAWTVFNFTGTTNTTTPTGFTAINGGGGGAGNVEVIGYYDLSTSPGAYGTITGDLADPEFALSAAMELVTAAAGGSSPTRRMLLLGVGGH